MPKANENIPFLDDLPSAPTEPPAFTSDQMLRCDQCLRANPPTRVNCLYCGQALAVSETTLARLRPSLRPLESWEQGYSNVVLPAADYEPGSAAREIASLLRVETESVERVLSAGRPLPLARTAISEEARLIGRRLKDYGIDSLIVSDQDLHIESSPPRRLRALNLGESECVALEASGKEGARMNWRDISCLVVGRLFAKQIELRERKRRRAENQILDSTEGITDEAVLDIYCDKVEGSWRIGANGFDFSCLAQDKALLAKDNFLTLIAILRDRAKGAVYDDAYGSLRQALEVAWPAERRTESRGLRLSGMNRLSTGEVITTSNEMQFTRYTRLYCFLRACSLV